MKAVKCNKCDKEATKHIKADLDLPTLHYCEQHYLEFIVERYALFDND